MSAQDNSLETLSQSEVESQDTQGAAQPEPLLGDWPQEAAASEARKRADCA